LKLVSSKNMRVKIRDRDIEFRVGVPLDIEDSLAREILSKPFLSRYIRRYESDIIKEILDRLEKLERRVKRLEEHIITDWR